MIDNIDLQAKETKSKTLAAIVTHNPNIALLLQNILSICEQVDKVLVIDNGSSNLTQIESLQVKANFQVKALNRNTGIAYALQIGLDIAQKENYQFLLTMDQDSFFIDPCHSIARMSEIFKFHEKIAVVGPTLQLANALITEKSECDLSSEVDMVITSGALCDVKKLCQIGGVNIELFIDAVDHDLCYRLRREGYMIRKINTVHLSHELGQMKRHRLLWKKPYSTHHSAFRLYYMGRNYKYCIREFIDVPEVKNMLQFFKHKKIMILLFEKHKLKKLRALRKGFKEGKAFTTKFAINAIPHK